ncbi:hypothetical protein [Flavimarina sp. Hel_I_48]|uniref:hypothetical protein n=1 Tax=Flavimarina sp. Hel_I_48 TaxID=1392488 RepID=UPI0013DBF7B3|nr:hypothetical protein [Flavimarina sp. Hel_I_48]
MNTITKLGLTAALAVSSFSFANGNPPSGVKPLSISAEISELLGKNAIAVKEVSTIQVTFVVNSDYEMVITDVDTDNPEVEQFIKSSLNYKKLKAKAKKGQRYFLQVTFKI